MIMPTIGKIEAQSRRKVSCIDWYYIHIAPQDAIFCSRHPGESRDPGFFKMDTVVKPWYDNKILISK